VLQEVKVHKELKEVEVQQELKVLQEDKVHKEPKEV
jgi:hypothetical protein